MRAPPRFDFASGADHGPPPVVLIRDSPTGKPSRWLLFRQPLQVHVAHSLEQVVAAVAAVEEATEAGLWAVGFLAYEAAPAFDPALEAHLPGDLPLAWWGVFEGPEQSFDSDPWGAEELATSPKLDWWPQLQREAYGEAFAQIREAIAAGDTYQVNFTFPWQASFTEAAWPFFRNLVRTAPYGAYLDTGRFVICSASPELFFEFEDGQLRTRPMKGTAPRGRSAEEDIELAAALAASSKDRAENVMIVDMMRNDLGRIARPGTVRVEELFTVETYPTVHQLTSTVVAESSASWREVLQALFPCASITGAPKVSTSRIIRQLEAEPRGVYTGAVGLLSPQRAQLSVAIRTATIDRQGRTARYGTGGGIVWDSQVEGEYEECLMKAQVLRPAPPSFALLETLLWRPKSGYFLLERHLSRLLASARYFGYPLDLEAVRAALDEIEPSFEETRQRVRFEAFRDGRLQVTHEAWPCSGRTRWHIVLDDRPTDTTDPFLFHKTTHRKVYDEALERRGSADEVVLWNERGELTETCRANLVLEVDGERLTPALHCGLLAGTYRAELLHRGRIREAVLPIEMLNKAEKIFLVNSLRGWIHVEPLEWKVKASNSPSPAPMILTPEAAKA